VKPRTRQATGSVLLAAGLVCGAWGVFATLGTWMVRMIQAGNLFWAVMLCGATLTLVGYAMIRSVR